MKKPNELTILIVDDEASKRDRIHELVDTALSKHPHSILHAVDYDHAKKRLEGARLEGAQFDVVITDLNLNSRSDDPQAFLEGLDVASMARSYFARTRVFCATSRGVTDRLSLYARERVGAVEMLDRATGDMDQDGYLPWERKLEERLREVAIEAARFRSELDLYEFDKIEEEIARIADSRKPALFFGEIGTGKSTYVHRLAELSNKRVKHVNCAALAQGNALLTSLFGVIPNFFTGVHASPGIFEMVDENWIVFLDEVGRLSLEAQGALLQVLEEGTFQRAPFIDVYEREVYQPDPPAKSTQKSREDPAQKAKDAVKALYPGAPAYLLNGNYAVNERRELRCRLVFATNQDLAQAVQKELFLPDLYTRLMSYVVELPRLQERGAEHIRAMTEKFLAANPDASTRKVTGLSDGAIRRLVAHSWPGNVRELIHVLDAAILRAKKGGEVQAEDIRFFRWPEKGTQLPSILQKD